MQGSGLDINTRIQSAGNMNVMHGKEYGKMKRALNEDSFLLSFQKIDLI